MNGADNRSPRERYLTVFGRVAVLEALADPELTVAQVFLATDLATGTVREIAVRAAEDGVAVQRVSRDKVTRVSGTGTQHQGVAADVVAPNRSSLESWLAALESEQTTVCVLLDGITTPANVGMLVRSAVGAGLHGIVVPTHGVSDIGPMVIKASAGVAFRAPLLRVRTAGEAARQLHAAGFVLTGLDAGGGHTIWDVPLGPRTALVLGGEHAGVSADVREFVAQTARIPMADDVESLNVAAAGAIAFFEVARRALGPPPVSTANG